MALADQLIRDGSLKSEGQTVSLDLGLPWFRSLPMACINNVTIEIDGERFSGTDLTLKIGDRQIAVSEIPDQEDLGEWFLQDRYKFFISKKLEKDSLHSVRAQVDMVIANFTKSADKPFLMSMFRETQLTVR